MQYLRWGLTSLDYLRWGIVSIIFLLALYLASRPFQLLAYGIYLKRCLFIDVKWVSGHSYCPLIPVIVLLVLTSPLYLFDVTAVCIALAIVGVELIGVILCERIAHRMFMQEAREKGKLK
jgi:hypothetical protein